jgi:hypothetical protein
MWITGRFHGSHRFQPPLHVSSVSPFKRGRRRTKTVDLGVLDMGSTLENTNGANGVRRRDRERREREHERRERGEASGPRNMRKGPRTVRKGPRKGWNVGTTECARGSTNGVIPIWRPNCKNQINLWVWRAVAERCSECTLRLSGGIICCSGMAGGGSGRGGGRAEARPYPIYIEGIRGRGGGRAEARPYPIYIEGIRGRGGGRAEARPCHI